MKSRSEMLNAYLSEVRQTRFRPGSHDCGLYVAGWVSRVTGRDHGAIWRGQYRSMDELRLLVEDAGYTSHVDYVASLFPEVPPSFAQTGDLAVVDGEALGIMASERVFVLRPDGLGHVPRRMAHRAFTIKQGD